MWAMRTTSVEFEGALGDRIVGLLDLPEGEPKAFGIFAHCFTCSKNLRIAPEIAKQLNAEGLALLRFDFTGLGQSGGEFELTSFRTNTRDVLAAAAFLEREHEAPEFLIGHSLGGAAVLSVGNDIGSVRCVATIAAPRSPPTSARSSATPTSTTAASPTSRSTAARSPSARRSSRTWRRTTWRRRRVASAGRC